MSPYNAKGRIDRQTDGQTDRRTEKQDPQCGLLVWPHNKLLSHRSLQATYVFGSHWWFL